ncbi:hypothetical protein FO519_001976, partial [Halicephalobus sp. NKZ332]
QSAIANYYDFAYHESALGLDDRPGFSNPVAPDASLLGTNGYDLFGDAAYDKASSVIATLKNVYGNDTIFNQGLHNYLETHAFRNAQDLDLWKSMDSIAQTYKIKGWTGSTLNATAMMLPYTKQFSAPLISWLATTSGSLPSSNGPLILNPGAETHARVLYDDATWAPIYNTLKQNPESIDEMTRAQLLADSWAFVKEKKISWERFLNHTTYLTNENSFVPWQYAFRGNRFINTFLYNFRFHGAFTNLKTYFARITSNLKLGDFIRGDNWSQNMLNSSLLELQCLIENSLCRASALNFFNKFITQCQYASEGTGKCNPASPEFRSTQLCYGLNQNKAGFGVLKSLADWWRNNPASNSYFPQDSESIVRGLSCSNDIPSINNLINATLNYQLSPDFLQNLGDNDVGGSTLYNYLSSNTASVVNSEFFSKYINAMTTSWGTEDQLNLIKNFKWPTLSDDQQQVVDGAVQKISNLKDWLSNDGSDIQKWIDNFVSS